VTLGRAFLARGLLGHRIFDAAELVLARAASSSMRSAWASINEEVANMGCNASRGRIRTRSPRLRSRPAARAPAEARDELIASRKAAGRGLLALRPCSEALRGGQLMKLREPPPGICRVSRMRRQLLLDEAGCGGC